MIKIQDKVREIILDDEEARVALVRNFMNLSKYAKQIRPQVEEATMKDVKESGIVVALSRLQTELEDADPFRQDVIIDNLSTKSPIVEMTFPKTSTVINSYSGLYSKLSPKGDDFLTIVQSTNEVTVICSARIKDGVIKHMKQDAKILGENLATLSISFDEKYYDEPNVTYSLLRKIARKRIVLAEVISTHSEVTFLFNQKYLANIVELFKPEQK